jgi:hypothetical protein
MHIKTGQRLRSQVDPTEVIVVRLRCGGAEMIDVKAVADPALTAKTGSGEPAVLGKRYTDGSGDLEILATKGGSHAITVGLEPLRLKEAKPLPSSD